MGKKHPYYVKSMRINFTDIPNTMGFVAFFHTVENLLGNPCISHMLKYTIGWELDGKKAPILWEKYGYRFPRLSPIPWVLLHFPLLWKIFWETHAFPIWWNLLISSCVLYKMFEKHLWDSLLLYLVVEILQLVHKIRCSIKQMFWKTSQNSQINKRNSHPDGFCQKMFLKVLQNSQKNISASKHYLKRDSNSSIFLWIL